MKAPDELAKELQKVADFFQTRAPIGDPSNWIVLFDAWINIKYGMQRGDDLK